MSKMEFDVVHGAAIKHQAADALSQLPITVENCNPIDDALTVISVSSLPKAERKGRIYPKDVING